MFTVALIGPDGAGKTTISRRIEHTLPLSVKYMYMGVNHDASNYMLPTTRLSLLLKRALGVKKDMGGPREPDAPVSRNRGLSRRVLSTVKSSLSLLNRLSEEWYRQALAWYYRRQRHIVLFDRHYFSDFYAYDIAKSGRPRPLNRRIHGFVLNYLYPKPDLTIYLDAPPDVLFSRKREGTLELLQRRRQDYLQIRTAVKHFEIVDATRSPDEVAGDVTDRIWRFYEARAGTNGKNTNATQSEYAARNPSN